MNPSSLFCCLFARFATSGRWQGLDDNWQACSAYGEDAFTYHDESGEPQINYERFPDFKAMVDYAHGLGLTAGWYGNNCICKDHCGNGEC